MHDAPWFICLCLRKQTKTSYANDGRKSQHSSFAVKNTTGKLCSTVNKKPVKLRKLMYCATTVHVTVYDNDEVNECWSNKVCETLTNSIKKPSAKERKVAHLDNTSSTCTNAADTTLPDQMTSCQGCMSSTLVCVSLALCDSSGKTRWVQNLDTRSSDYMCSMWRGVRARWMRKNKRWQTPSDSSTREEPQTLNPWIFLAKSRRPEYCLNSSPQAKRLHMTLSYKRPQAFRMVRNKVIQGH